MSTPISLTLPHDAPFLASQPAGTALLLSGTMFTMRDAGHKRCLEYLNAHRELPFSLAGQTLFYAGPTPTRSGLPFGAIGPTTASRMDFAAPQLYQAGIVATIGKGKRSEDVKAACIEHGTVYLAAVGGIAAKLANCVVAAECIAWEDLGTEALWRIEVKDFPAYVALDAEGNTLYL